MIETQKQIYLIGNKTIGVFLANRIQYEKKTFVYIYNCTVSINTIQKKQEKKNLEMKQEKKDGGE